MTLVSEASTLSTVMVVEPNPETVMERNRVKLLGAWNCQEQLSTYLLTYVCAHTCTWGQRSTGQHQVCALNLTKPGTLLAMSSREPLPPQSQG